MNTQVALHYLEGRVKQGYTDFGMIWEKGSVSKEDVFELIADGENANLQTRVTAYWPDHSVKWTAHTAYLPEGAKDITLQKTGRGKTVRGEITYSDTPNYLKLTTKNIQATFNKRGQDVISHLIINGRETAVNGKLIALLEKHTGSLYHEVKENIAYISQVSEVVLEEIGPLKAVIKVSGFHYNEDLKRNVLPFTLRFTFHYEDVSVGVTHSFIYDGDADKDYLKGLGMQFDCPLEGEVYNRHIKFGGDHGYFSEALQMLLSWRPKLRPGLYEEQMAGQIMHFDKEKEPEVFEAMKKITVWDSYHFVQDHANNYDIKKRTAHTSCAYIDCMSGERAKGIAAITGEQGGMAIAMRDFWQRYPSGMWLDHLTENTAQFTAWFWSPDAKAMDFRHYDTVGHDGPYYEGFDEVRSTPYGIANTSELTIIGLGAMPNEGKLDEWVERVNKPSLLLATPAYYHSLKAFGPWSLVKKDTDLEVWLEEQMDLAIDFYKKEIEQRKWYGFFNYGDVMHTYDQARHCWRYDMGGYAWQNTELVPTLWLWYAFLRTQREDIYTLAEAMSRHCSEVDVYHIGEYKGIGSRHNVLHWGCACKEARIAMAGHHRIFYYLTGNHRMEDIFEDVKDGDFSTVNIDPLRFFYDKEKMIDPTHARTGPDWSTYCSNWLTEWERKENNTYRDKILTGIEDIKKAPLQLISGSDFEYNPETSHLRYIGENAAGGSHLVICMGAAQTWLELMDLIEDEEWKKMLADFGVCYFATKEERQVIMKGLASSGGFGLPYMIASIGAHAASYYKNEALANKVWKTLVAALTDSAGKAGFKTTKVPYINEESIEEIDWISTNFTAQWCLNAIYCLELIHDYLPKAEDVL